MEDENSIFHGTNQELKEIKEKMLEIREENDVDRRDSMLKSTWNSITHLVIRLHSMISNNININNLL